MQQNSSNSHTHKTHATFYKGDGMKDGPPEDFSLLLAGSGKTPKSKFSDLKKHYETHIRKHIEANHIKEGQKKEHYSSSEIDEETGVYNHHGLKNRFKQELDRAKKERHTIRALILFLHEAGEAQIAATILSLCARPYDIVARIHDNEFLVILPDSDEDVVQQFWDRANMMFTEGNYTLNNEKVRFKPIKIYGGTSEIDIRQIEESLELADKAAYKAKKLSTDSHKNVLTKLAELTDEEILSVHTRKIGIS